MKKKKDINNKIQRPNKFQWIFALTLVRWIVSGLTILDMIAVRVSITVMRYLWNTNIPTDMLCRSMVNAVNVFWNLFLWINLLKKCRYFGGEKVILRNSFLKRIGFLRDRFSLIILFTKRKDKFSFFFVPMNSIDFCTEAFCCLFMLVRNETTHQTNWSLSSSSTFSHFFIKFEIRIPQ